MWVPVISLNISHFNSFFKRTIYIYNLYIIHSMNGSEHASARKKRDYMCFLGTLIAMTHLSVDRFPSISRICVIDTGYAFQMTFYFLFAASVLQLPHCDFHRAYAIMCAQSKFGHVNVVRSIFHSEKLYIMDIYIFYMWNENFWCANWHVLLMRKELIELISRQVSHARWRCH